MIQEFDKLREDQIEVLLKAPVYVSLLIAGADGTVDKQEIKEAVEVARNKQSRARDQLVPFYREVGKTFEAEFNRLSQELPADLDERTKVLTAELRKLNFILPLIDRNFAVKLIASLKEMAKKIAEASGGVLGYLSVSYEESKLIELNMIKDPSL